MRAVFVLCRLALGVVFVYAGALKMADAQGFAQSVYNYQLLPASFVYGAAMLLPAVEVVCGLALCAGFAARGASIILNALMVCFMAALGVAAARGLNVDCGCFGQASQGTVSEALVRDAVILAVGLVATWGAFATDRDDEV